MHMAQRKNAREPEVFDGRLGRVGFLDCVCLLKVCGLDLTTLEFQGKRLGVHEEPLSTRSRAMLEVLYLHELLKGGSTMEISSG